MHIFYICVSVHRTATDYGELYFFVDFSWSLKHCSAWEESQIWQLPKLQAFLSLTYMLTHNILLKDTCTCVRIHIWCK